MINRISPFILEILLGIAISYLVYTYVGNKNITIFITNNSNTLHTVYGTLLSLNFAFSVYLFQEKDDSFIKFLRTENADGWYLKAIFFNIIILALGILSILFYQSFLDSSTSLKIIYAIFGINFIQLFTSLILWYNYIDLKRTFQTKK